MKILVLGLGNDLYGDDGVGIEAVKRLRDEWAAESPPRSASLEISFLECTLSGAALLDVVRGHDALVIIDTINREDPDTGRVHILDGADIRDVPGPSPHYISVPQTLALGDQLGLDMPRSVKIVGVEAKCLFTLGEGLSEEMSARMPAILDAARSVLLDLASGL
jgi:hydrogenase maturation protease